MIILPEPNNNLWIYDDKELENFEYSDITKRKKAIELIPQHDYRDFCHILADMDTHFIPRKMTVRGYWNANSNVNEVFDSLRIRKRKIDNIYIYQMSWGEIFMIYEGADIGGYDVERRFKIFRDIGEYNENFYLS